MPRTRINEHSDIRLLRRLAWIGLAVGVVGALGAYIHGFKMDLHRAQPSRFAGTCLCDDQWDHFHLRLQSESMELVIAERRLKSLNSMRVDPSSIHYIQAQSEYLAESERVSQLRHKLELLDVQLIPETAPLEIGLNVFFAFILFKCGKTIWRSWTRLRMGPLTEGFPWKSRYIAIVTSLFLIDRIRLALTSVWIVEKEWFQWQSFCVSPPAFLWFKLSYLGICMIAAYPATLLWIVSSARRIPRRLDINAPDGRCGVGGYLSLLHFWFIVGGFILVSVAATWASATVINQDGYNRAYLLSIAATVAGGVLLLSRLVRCAWIVRRRYYARVSRLRSKWPEHGQSIAPDPTHAFLGTDLWRAVAGAGAIILFAWTMAEISGLPQGLNF